MKTGGLVRTYHHTHTHTHTRKTHACMCTYSRACIQKHACMHTYLRACTQQTENSCVHAHVHPHTGEGGRSKASAASTRGGPLSDRPMSHSAFAHHGEPTRGSALNQSFTSVPGASFASARVPLAVRDLTTGLPFCGNSLGVHSAAVLHSTAPPAAPQPARTDGAPLRLAASAAGAPELTAHHMPIL